MIRHLLFRLGWWLRGIPLLLLMSGCAGTPSYKAADCDRFRFPTKDFNILVCNDEAVQAYFKMHSPKFDSIEVSHVVVDSEGKAKDMVSVLADDCRKSAMVANSTAA